MKRILSSLLVLSFATLACNIQTPANPTQPPVETESLVVGTEPPVVTNAPMLVNTTCNQLSFYLDPMLASSFTCETIPESAEMMDIYPEHTRLTLQGYPLSNTFFQPVIAVYPVQRYSELLPDLIPGQVSILEGLLGGAAPGQSDLPFLPTFNAAQVFDAQYQVIPFVSGKGIRYLTLYAQYTAPVNNQDLFYTYQGLTDDKRFWVSAILPVSHPLLPATGENPPEGMSWEDFGDNYLQYVLEIQSQLNDQAPESFTPSLLLLDTLASTITIQP